MNRLKPIKNKNYKTKFDYKNNKFNLSKRDKYLIKPTKIIKNTKPTISPIQKLYNELSRIYGDIWHIVNLGKSYTIKSNIDIFIDYDFHLEFKIFDDDIYLHDCTKINSIWYQYSDYSIPIINLATNNIYKWLNKTRNIITFSSEIQKTLKLSINKFLLFDKINFVVNNHILGMEFDIGKIIFKYYMEVFFIIDL
jgi:hypothetical protein